MKKIYKYLLPFVSLIFLLSACTKDFVEMNTDPNAPVDVPLENELAGAMIKFDGGFMPISNNNIMLSVNYVGGRWGNAYPPDISSTYQNWTSENWGGYYTTMTNLNDIIAKATEAEAHNMLAAALTYRAEITQIATDRWGEMPYYEACKASEGVLRPAYDDQETIYSEIIKDLKTAADIFKEGYDDPIGTVDPFYHGDVSKWQKLCNSLRLRVAVRISFVDEATAKSIISEVLGNPTDYPISEDIDDRAEITYAGDNTWGVGFWYWNNLLLHSGPGERIVNILKAYNDPRLPRIAEPAISDGEYRGTSRVGRSQEYEVEDISYFQRNYYVVNGTTGPNIHYRHSEVCFNKAEFFLRGLYPGGDAAAQQAYEEGVYSSMKELSIMVDGTPQIADDVIDAYLASDSTSWSGTTQEKLRKIWIQKYIAMCFMQNEPWAEMRRTDTPTDYPAVGCYYPNHNRGPFRCPYPADEELMNSENSKPYFERQYAGDYLWGAQLWWDKRTGVY
ncbi:MAG TPA: SusD/RagB family nutrient-binding outer membrane lipoprotein [Bacteroidetes bacterium]|nr:SusD/RagB family nutrient-binding outer membrane lipoprotein [Bacteroidota bacterium]